MGRGHSPAFSFMNDLTKILKYCKAGKKSYQEKLYDLFCNMVMGICLRYVGDRIAAEDVFQEVFIKVFQKLEDVKSPEALPGWIRRIAVNSALDAIKVQNHSLFPNNEKLDNDDHYYNEIIDKITTDELLDIVNELPEGYRVVFNLFAIDGYSHKEISEKLRIAESTSRSQLTFAKKLLQKKLKKLGITRYESVV